MRRAIAAGIAVSTIGFLSQGMLTAPRVYYAMARDGVFFQRVGTLNERTRAPVTAIALQGIWACAIVLFFQLYGPVLNYVVALDAVFFGLTGAALLVFRRRYPAAVKGMRKGSMLAPATAGSPAAMAVDDGASMGTKPCSRTIAWPAAPSTKERKAAPSRLGAPRV